MVDCHMHMVLDGQDWKEAIHTHREAPCKALIEKRLESYRQRGYTYLRDGGDRWGVGKLARDLSAKYGITYRTPLAPLCKEGCYGAFIGEVFADLKEYAKLVVKQKEAGADFIKIMISGLMDFAKPGVIFMEGPTAAEIKQMVHPKSVNVIRVNGKKMGPDLVKNIYIYMISYIVIMIVSVLLVSINNMDFGSTFTSVLTTMNNVGPGIGGVGPTGSFADFSPFSKLVFCFDMLAGRLEIFPFLMILTAFRWRKSF